MTVALKSVVGRARRDAHGVLCRRVQPTGSRFVFEIRREEFLGKLDFVVCFAGHRVQRCNSLKRALRACRLRARIMTSNA